MTAIHADLQVLPAEQYHRTPWKNGGGWTREIVRMPRHGDHGSHGGWDWRLSIAEIERDGPFSLFPGVERELVLLTGNGMHLCFDDDGSRHLLEPPHASLRFSGERPMRAELVDGPTTDFNMMWRREAVTAQLWHRPLVGTTALFVEPGQHWVLYQLAGHAQLRNGEGSDAGLPLTQTDTALVRAPGDARARCVVDGAGVLLLIRIDPLLRSDDAEAVVAA